MVVPQAGGYLAEPKTVDQMVLVEELVELEVADSGRRNWWLGLSDVGYEGIWTWIHSNQVI